VDLVTNTRTITTSVFVNDGEVLVLGGLIDDQLREGEQKVPGLGSIPGLGWLFRKRTTNRDRSNLMVFIRPTILRDAEDARFMTNQKYRYIQDVQRQMAQEPVQLMRNETRPEIPPLPEEGPPEPTPETPSSDTPANDGSQPQ
jgi:general secretion pathway protein D